MPEHEAVRVTELRQIPNFERYVIAFSRYDPETGYRMGLPEEYILTAEQLLEAIEGWEARGVILQ